MINTETGRRAQHIAFGIVCLAIVLFMGAALARHEFPIDTYKAFYCGGRSVLEHTNPYLMEPLRSCEHRIFSADDFPAFAVEPAPLPSYVLAGFAVLALLPPQVSHGVFLAALVLALFVTGWAVAAITRYSPAIVTLTCASLWLISTAYGEIPPFCVAAIALCGLSIERKRPVIAGIFACAAMIQPHVALPLCIALLLFVPASRVAIFSGWAVLLALSLLVTGFSTTLAYFTTYLPLQALSEISASDQYSLTYVLHVFGTPDRLALTLGSLSYALMAVLGIYAGRRLSADLATRALLVFAPPAFVLLGGTFVHDTQMFAALPLALTLLARLRSHRVEVSVALALLCISWTTTGSAAAILIGLSSAFAAGRLIFAASNRWPLAAGTLAIVLSVGAMLVNRLPAASFEMTIPADAASISADAPSSEGWNALLRSVPFRSRPSLRSEARKLPTWIALALLAGAALAASRRQEKAEEDVRYANADAV